MALFDFLQPQTNQTNDPFKDQLMTLTDVIAPSAIKITPRTINISGINARTYYAVSYPRYLNDGWIERTGDDLVHSWPPRRQRLAWRRPVRRRARSHQTDSYHRTRNEYELRAHRCRDPSVEVSN